MSDRSQDSSETDKALRKRLELLKDHLDREKIRIAPGLDVIESLKRVRFNADGSADLSTVDGMVRSMALVVEHMHNREEMKKKVPLAEIQLGYFRFLETNFGRYYNVMVERGLTPHDAGVAVTRSNASIAEIIPAVGPLMEFVDEFWGELGPIAMAHVEDMAGALKGVFGGDLFPAADESIASKCSIYADTLILPDPFLRSRLIFERLDDRDKAFYLVKHAMNLLKYRELACADVTPPIIVILPDAPGESEKSFFRALGEEDAIYHGERVFGRNFSSISEMIEFCRSLDTVERAVEQIRDPRRVLFDSTWEGTLGEQIARATGEGRFKTLLPDTLPGTLILSQAIGRMASSNELLVRARRLNGTPIVDAPTSWQYLVWKLEYDAARVESASGLKDLHTLRGLQSLAKSEMTWLGQVPHDALIVVRKDGALDEIRSTLSQGVEQLADANPANFHRTSDQVFDNIHRAFEQHQQKVKELTAKKWKFAGRDVGSWLVVGSIEAAAAAIGTPVWGLAAYAANQLFEVPKLRELPKSLKELAAESAGLKKSPIGLLFSYSKRK